MAVLVTGFEPMQGWLRNVSKELVHSLIAELPQPLAPHADQLRMEVLPADTTALKARIEQLLDTGQFGCALHFGQSVGRNKISLERIAVNILEFTGDQAGNTVTAGQVEPGAPAAYFSTLPGLEELARELRECGIPAEVSNYAGTSLCNQLLYHTLHHGALRRRVPAAFVHIPVLPEQVIEQWHGAPAMTLEQLRTAAARLILSALSQPPRSIL